MKALLLTLGLLCLGVRGFGQGQFIFANSAATTITNCLTWLPAAGSAAQDDTQVGLYIGNVGAPVSSLALSGPTTNCFLPGRFNGGTRTLAGVTGTVQMQVRAWLASTVYPSYEAAYMGALGGDASVILGVSAAFNFALTTSPTPPISIPNAGLTPIIIGPLTCVPEPSTSLLAMMALAAGGWIRRRI